MILASLGYAFFVGFGIGSNRRDIDLVAGILALLSVFDSTMRIEDYSSLLNLVLWIVGLCLFGGLYCSGYYVGRRWFKA